MVGAEGKLFRPLAFTKTAALTASLVIALFLIPPFAALIFRKRSFKKTTARTLNALLIVLGVIAIFYGVWLGLLLIAFGALYFLRAAKALPFNNLKNAEGILTVVAIAILLATYWRPLGFNRSILINFIFVALLCAAFFGAFWLLRRFYERILGWALANRIVFLSIPLGLLISGGFILSNAGKEFMPALNEGTFLLMPTSLPHAGVEEQTGVATA